MVTRFTGESADATRLAFKATAALCVMAALVLLDRRRAEPAAIAFVGLHPVTILFGVAGGHNDAMVGLGILAAVLLVERRRLTWAGVAVAVACLVKVAAMLAVVGLAVWLWHRPAPEARRQAKVFAGASLGTVALGYVLAGGLTALGPLRAASRMVAWNSYWRPVQHWLGTTAFRGDASSLATALVLLVVTLLLLRHRHDAGPEVLVTALLLAYVVASAYSLTWYLLWVLPVAAVRWRTASSWLVVAVASAYVLPPAEHVGLYVTTLTAVAALVAASLRPPVSISSPSVLDPSATPGPA